MFLYVCMVINTDLIDVELTKKNKNEYDSPKLWYGWFFVVFLQTYTVTWNMDFYLQMAF